MKFSHIYWPIRKQNLDLYWNWSYKSCAYWKEV